MMENRRIQITDYISIWSKTSSRRLAFVPGDLIVPQMHSNRMISNWILDASQLFNEISISLLKSHGSVSKYPQNQSHISKVYWLGYAPESYLHCPKPCPVPDTFSLLVLFSSLSISSTPIFGGVTNKQCNSSVDHEIQNPPIISKNNF